MLWKDLVDEFQAATAHSRNIATIEDMQACARRRLSQIGILSASGEQIDGSQASAHAQQAH